MTQPMLSTQQLDLSIGNTQVCQALDLTIDAGQRWAILGRNGIGKTTLLHALAGFKTEHHASVHYQNKSLEQWPASDLALMRGLLPQHHDDHFPSTVLETALTGRHPHIKSWQWESEHDVAHARRALAQLELSDLEQRSIHQLSGGERQRLAIATLLTQDPKLLLLDEPTNHLDIQHQISSLELLKSLALEKQKAIVMTLHDVNLAQRFCSHALLLFGQGQFMAGSIATTLDSHTLSQLYQHPIKAIASDQGPIFVAS